MKHWKQAVPALLLSMLMTGCNVMNVSVMDVTNSSDNGIESRFLKKSGTNIQRVDLSQEELSLQFTCELEQGSVRLRIVDADGMDVYDQTLTDSSSDSAQLDEAGRYRLIVECDGASGNYAVTWGGDAPKEEP